MCVTHIQTVKVGSLSRLGFGFLNRFNCLILSCEENNHKCQLKTNLTQHFRIRHNHPLPMTFELYKHQDVIGVSLKTTGISVTPCDIKPVTSCCSLLCLYLGYTVHRPPVSSSLASQPLCVTPKDLFITLASSKVRFTFFHLPCDKGTLWLMSSKH